MKVYEMTTANGPLIVEIPRGCRAKIELTRDIERRTATVQRRARGNGHPWPHTTARRLHYEGWGRRAGDKEAHQDRRHDVSTAREIRDTVGVGLRGTDLIERRENPACILGYDPVTRTRSIRRRKYEERRVTPASVNSPNNKWRRKGEDRRSGVGATGALYGTSPDPRIRALERRGAKTLKFRPYSPLELATDKLADAPQPKRQPDATANEKASIAEDTIHPWRGEALSAYEVACLVVWL